MPVDHRAVLAAADAVLAGARDPRYAHTSHLHVRVGRDVLVDEHLRGPLAADVFSVTKSVLATVLGAAARRGLLPPLHEPVAAVLPALRGTPAARHTWHHLLTMTRGAETDGPWDVDEVTALPGGQVDHVARAPQRTPPGESFRYDNGAAHLLSAAASAALDEPVDAFAHRELLDPLGVQGAEWGRDPDGVPFGYAHLRIRAADLGRLGRLWLDGGVHDGATLVEPDFLARMTRPHSPGGPPEHRPYGYLIWIDDGAWLAGGWAGQHVLVLPAADAVVVVTGDPRFTAGPPARDELPPDWAPALDLVRRHLLPALR